MSMGKMLFAGGLIAALGGILMYIITARTGKEQGEYIGVGFGQPGETVEMNLTVSIVMTHKDGPKPGKLPINWDDWVKDHFTLTDASGATMPLRRLNFSKLIPDKIAGTYDFFLTANLKPGASYTCTFQPFAADPSKKYEWKLTAPTQPTEPERQEFAPL